MKVKKSGRKSHVARTMNEDDDALLDVDLSLVPSLVPEAGVLPREAQTKAARSPPRSEANPRVEATLEATIEKKDESASELAKPGKNVIVHLPKLSFIDSSGASARFLRELQKTIGAAGEVYNGPPLMFRVKLYAADSQLPPSLEGYNKAFGTDLREELMAIHVPGSSEDDDPYNLPLLWGAKDGVHDVDEAAKVVFKKFGGDMGEVEGKELQRRERSAPLEPPKSSRHPLRVVKLNFYKQLWAASGCDHARLITQKQLA
nr:uncharacterized protein LOC117843266 [Setaria viridis]XP_034579728.1 uncharacterized protein LOC117843266 [Setaria viridis]